MKRVGIMGGTFDPIHLGHLMLGKQARDEYGMDEIWYMPSRVPPHKKDHPITPSAQRCEMIREASRPYERFLLSEFELARRDGNTYTADTLRLLKEAWPETEFYFILGADSVMDIEKWYRPDYVLRAVPFMVADREPAHALDGQIRYLEQTYGARFLRLHCREMDVSSADIRARLQNGEDVSSLLPASVADYIRQKRLYRAENTSGGKKGELCTAKSSPYENI